VHPRARDVEGARQVRLRQEEADGVLEGDERLQQLLRMWRRPGLGRIEEAEGGEEATLRAAHDPQLGALQPHAAQPQPAGQQREGLHADGDALDPQTGALRVRPQSDVFALQLDAHAQREANPSDLDGRAGQHRQAPLGQLPEVLRREPPGDRQTRRNCREQEAEHEDSDH
jgi:hypothetical protein